MVKPKVDPLSVLNPNDYSTSLKVSANGISVCTPSPANPAQDFEHYFWAYTDFYKWSLLSQNGKLALLVNVFSDSTFTKRIEYIFRNKEAVRLATAIEYFIENFMTVLHIRLELVPGSFDTAAAAAETRAGPTSSQYASASDGKTTRTRLLRQRHLLDLNDEGETTPAAAATTTISGGPSDDLLGAVAISTTGGGGGASSTLGGDEAVAVFGGTDDPFGGDPSARAHQLRPSKPLLSQKTRRQHHAWFQQAFANRRASV